MTVDLDAERDGVRRNRRESMSRAKTLVTGATGLTGSHTVQLLLKRGHTVRVLAHNEDERSTRLQELGAEVVIGDLLNFNDVRLALRGIRGAYFVYPLSPTGDGDLCTSRQRNRSRNRGEYVTVELTPEREEPGNDQPLAL